MFKHLTTNHLAMVAIALDDEQETTKSKKRVWVHEILKRRKLEGEFYTLCTKNTKKFFLFILE